MDMIPRVHRLRPLHPLEVLLPLTPVKHPTQHLRAAFTAVPHYASLLLSSSPSRLALTMKGAPGRSAAPRYPTRASRQPAPYLPYPAMTGLGVLVMASRGSSARHVSLCSVMRSGSPGAQTSQPSGPSCLCVPGRGSRKAGNRQCLLEIPSEKHFWSDSIQTKVSHMYAGSTICAWSPHARGAV